MNNDHQVEELFPGESPGKPGEICILLNSIFYFVSSVLIINKNGCYRLVAKHNGKLLIDKVYNTLRGAKIAFSKLFGHRSWLEELKAEWSSFYKPDDQWLKKRCQETKSQN